MKRLFAFFALTLFMTSCSSDDSTTETITPQDNTLLKKTTRTTQDASVTTTYTYDGNKLMSIISSNGSGSNFTYTGDLITYVKSIYPDSDNLVTETNYEYNNNNQKISEIIHYKDDSYDYRQKRLFSYNDDGSITMQSYLAFENEEYVFEKNHTITYTGNTITITGLNTQTYDSKNSPMKNITGYKEYLSPLTYLNGHNRLTVSDGFTSITDTYNYNNNNYPATSTEVITQGGLTTTTSIQYFYE